MTWKDYFILLLVVVVFSFSAPAPARDQQERADEKRPASQRAYSSSPKDNEIYKLVEELREAYLLQELHLSGEKALAVVKKVRTAKAFRKNYALQRYIIENELHALLRSPVPDQTKISHSLQKLERAKLQYYQKCIEHDQALRQLLSPEEQAKYVLFQREFHQKLRDIIAKIRQQHEPSSASPNQLLRKKPAESVIRQSR